MDIAMMTLLFLMMYDLSRVLPLVVVCCFMVYGLDVLLD